MKTIFRYTNLAIVLAVIIALGTMSGLAQDPCTDAEGQTTLGDKFRAQFADKSIEGRKTAIETGKQFLEKYGACESAKDLADYLKGQLPKMEDAYKKAVEAKAKADLTGRFDAALKAKNWDEVYSSGKEILQKYPDEFRTVEIVLGSVGGEEALTKNNFKYNEDALKYAKQSIADLEAKKPFVIGNVTKYGIYEFSYKTPDEAIAWLNLYAGFITQVGLKNKAAALPYLYNATQAHDTKGKAVLYELISKYYIGELDKLYEDIQVIAKSQTDTDTEEVAKQKLEAIKAKIAMVNGTAERAMDALARAASLTKDAAVKTGFRNTLQEIYKRRFEKTEGLDAWVNAATAKPFVNPQTPIQPIVDPEPEKPATTTTTTTTPPAPVKPAPPATKPPATTTKPAPMPMPMTKPMNGTKPQATVKKRVVKKKTT